MSIILNSFCRHHRLAFHPCHDYRHICSFWRVFFGRMSVPGICRKEFSLPSTQPTRPSGDIAVLDLPQLRWEDVFCHGFGTGWKCLPLHSNFTGSHFKFILGVANFVLLEVRLYKLSTTPSADNQEPPQKQARVHEPRLVFEEPFFWGAPVSGCRLLVRGDSLLCINWLRGLWAPRDRAVRQYLSHMHNVLHQLHCLGVQPRNEESDLFYHIYRELNVVPDVLAASPMGDSAH